VNVCVRVYECVYVCNGCVCKSVSVFVNLCKTVCAIVYVGVCKYVCECS